MLKHPRLICSAAMLLAAAIGSMSSFGQPTPPADPAPAAKKMDIGPDGETLITIHVKDAFPEDAFSAIAKQSGIRFTAQPDTMWDSFKDDLTIDIDKKPFWVAVQELCAKTGLTIQQNGGNSPKRLTLIKMAQSGMTAQPPTFVSGAFMFRAESMNYNRSIYFGRPEQPNQNCNLQVLVSSDPNVKILAGHHLANR